MGSTLISVAISQLGLVSSGFRWDSAGRVRRREVIEFRTNSRKVCWNSAAGEDGTIGCLSNNGKRIAASCFGGKKVGNNVPEKLEPLWDDGYGTQTVKDYIERAKDLIKPDGPPRWFCPIECGCPLKDSPILLYLPGND